MAMARGVGSLLQVYTCVCVDGSDHTPHHHRAGEERRREGKVPGMSECLQCRWHSSSCRAQHRWSGISSAFEISNQFITVLTAGKGSV
jgi:hypothetical protein